jgi:parallel beta-helix repeat protein
MFHSAEDYSDPSNNNLISKNNIISNKYGISIPGLGHVSQGSYTTIIDNNIIGNLVSVSLVNSSYNKIIGNNILNNSEGVKLWSSSNNNIISGNNIKDINHGINIMFSCENNIIRRNNFMENSKQPVFFNSFPTLWFGNYWDEWDKSLPRPIYGEIKILNDNIVPWVQFDWKPATELYDLDV